MAVTFNRPSGVRYVDMCIYIDEHMKDVGTPYENEEIEAKIYEYLYHIIYALACKAGLFKNFSDYDSFACYGASELFLSMRNKIINAGKIVRGKEVVPIKSCLNYIKSIMGHLKINYQRAFFRTVLDPNLQDVSILEEDMKESIQQQYRGFFRDNYQDAVNEIPGIVRNVILQTPFKHDQVICRKLYMSCMLTLLTQLTLPAKSADKIRDKLENNYNNKNLQRALTAYKYNQSKAICWHIEENWDSYILFLVIKIKKEFSKQLQYYVHGNDLSDELIDGILATAYTQHEEKGDNF